MESVGNVNGSSQTTHGDQPQEAAGAGAPGETMRRRSGARRLTVKKKLLLSAATTLLAISLLELLLWLVGVRPLRDVHDSQLGFASASPLFTRTGDKYQTNEARLTYFNRQEFQATKPKHGLRIFCLGGSTTFGHPYRDPTSYSGWMREILGELDDEHTWEVVNCGGISYASHRMVRILEELVRYEPDVFIVYAGENEFLERHTYQSLQERPPLANAISQGLSRSRISTVLHQSLKGLRESTARDASGLMPDEVDAILDHTAGPTTYQRDPEYAASTVAQFRENLARMCRTSKAVGAHVILVKPGGNLRDFSPFKSEYSIKDFGDQLQVDLLLGRGMSLMDAGDASGALALFEEALGIDGQYARAAYLAGVAAFRSGDPAKAEDYFLVARDEDVCPLRANSAILKAIDEVGREENVRVVDFPALLSHRSRERSGCEAPGAESFLDHVHPTIEVNLELAAELVRAVAEQRLIPADRLQKLDTTTERVRQKVLGEIDPVDHALALSTVSQVLSWAGRTEEALRLAVQAAQQAPENVEVLAQLGRMYDKTSQVQAAREIYENALKLEPDNPLILYRLGRSWMIEGDYKRAAMLLEQALERTPLRAPRAHRIRLLESLGICYERLGRAEESSLMFARARRQ